MGARAAPLSGKSVEMAGFPDPGERVGRYEVVREVGRGPLGRVYEATDAQRSTTVALKVLVPAHGLDRVMRARLAIDLEALAALNSPQVVPVADYDEHDGRIFVASTWFPHGSLQARLDSHGPLGRAAALALGTHLAKALYDAHAVGVIHGGVKPANVFRGTGAGASALPQLGDFGATLRAGDWQDPGGLADAAAYAPPERAAGGTVDARGDVYGLGCLLYAALTGRPTPDQPDHPRRVPMLDEVDEGINAVLDRALQADPDQRFPDVAAMGRELTSLATAAQSGASASLGTRPAEPAAAVTSSAAVLDVPTAGVAASEPVTLPDAIAGPALAAVRDMVGVGADAPAAYPDGGGRHRRTPLLVGGVAAVALLAAGGSWVVGHQRADDHEDRGATNAPAATATATGGSAAPVAPKVQASAGYRAVAFALRPAADGRVELDLGKGWQASSASSVQVRTAAGGQKACLKARTTTADGAHSDPVEVCGTSAPATVRAVRVHPDCVVQGAPQVCYRLEARGFRSGTDPVLEFIVDNRAAGTSPVHIGADGTGTLPGGQHFHFADSDAGKTAIITLAGKTYRWKVAHR